MFDFLRLLLEGEESKVFFVLLLIAGAMIVDFVTGTVAAIFCPDISFKSKTGINGILRKVTSVIVLVFLVPVSVIIPGMMGPALLYTMFVGYLAMEMKSIFENLQKFGSDTSMLEQFLTYVKSGNKDSK